jgi:preprotein translocase subunit SecA
MTKFTELLRAGEGNKMKNIAKIVPLINDLEPVMRALTDEELKGQTALFRARLADGESLDDLLVEAFAVVREAAVRVLSQRHYDVQLMAGMALHFGWVAEMKTGEGKTLASTLPIYLNALAGEGVHVVTANNYLVQRDFLTLGPLFHSLGLSVGAVNPETTEFWMKRNSYNADITYGTCTEFGFDYLRDNMARDENGVVQRGFAYALVDEADSILIDEARTPLIISGPREGGREALTAIAALVRSLKADRDYSVDREHNVVFLKGSGSDKVEAYFGVDNLYSLENVEHLHHVTQALRAEYLQEKDRDYLVRDGKVEIIDAFTGRTLEGRRWSDGLHQALEAKEGVLIEAENDTWATITIQYYFKLYAKLSGMTGTAKTDEDEFAGIYGLTVVEIPTNLPSARTDRREVIYLTHDEKFDAIVAEVKERQTLGQPVLIGTASVARSEELSKALDAAGVEHTVLNAKQHASEAVIVAQAGRKGTVTVATNMAGRGVDVLLGGDPVGLAFAEAARRGLVAGTPEAQAEFDAILTEQRAACAREGDDVRALGGLCIIGSERHASRRIDDQLRGRAGRQGDVGETGFFLSLEDEIMEVFDGGSMSAVAAKVVKPGQPIRLKSVSRAVERAQVAAEVRDYQSRDQVFKYDDVMNEQRRVIYGLRREALTSTSLDVAFLTSFSKVMAEVIDRWCPSEFPEDWDTDGLADELGSYFTETVDAAWLSGFENQDALLDALTRLAHDQLERAAVDLSWEGSRATLRAAMLSAIDIHWRAHLLDMAALREGIGWRKVANRDPLSQWKLEGYESFAALMARIDDTFVTSVLHFTVADEPAPEGEPGADIAAEDLLEVEAP